MLVGLYETLAGQVHIKAHTGKNKYHVKSILSSVVNPPLIACCECQLHECVFVSMQFKAADSVLLPICYSDVATHMLTNASLSCEYHGLQVELTQQTLCIKALRAQHIIYTSQC